MLSHILSQCPECGAIAISVRSVLSSKHEKGLCCEGRITYIPLDNCCLVRNPLATTVAEIVNDEDVVLFNESIGQV